ncbi:MAG: hypothetical protein EPN36_09925 [Rhodanobacteraceae bacterium]|nr:MAG: hypothetical protein EPN36_09925 [Rhodanobacteraceae bacterium]
MKHAMREAVRTIDSSAPSQPERGHALPYGPVMATAGSAVLAGPCGLHVLTLPLLALAIVQAIWIAASGAAKFQTPWRHPVAWLAAIDHPNAHSGVHTVPLGLAIIAGALAGFAASGHWLVLPQPMIWGALALTWIATLVCVARCTAAWIIRPDTWQDVEGAWFLVPAAALGATVATVDAVPSTPVEWHVALDMLALVAGILGWFGYWIIAVTAARRIHRRGFGSTPRAPWWIAMGCAGLAAAALGRLLDATPSPPAAQLALKVGSLVVAITAVVLMIPVAILGARFLLRDCQFRERAAWPPTFSTAVFALGCLAAGSAWDSNTFRVLGLAGGFATLGLWAVTLCWNLSRELRRHAPDMS